MVRVYNVQSLLRVIKANGSAFGLNRAVPNHRASLLLQMHGPKTPHRRFPHAVFVAVVFKAKKSIKPGSLFASCAREIAIYKPS